MLHCSASVVVVLSMSEFVLATVAGGAGIQRFVEEAQQRLGVGGHKSASGTTYYPTL